MSDSREFYIFWDLNFVPFVLHKNILRMKQFRITFSKIYFSCNFKIYHEGKQENLSLKFVKESLIFQNKESVLTLLQYDDSIFETKLKFEWFKMIFSSLKIQKKERLGKHFAMKLFYCCAKVVWTNHCCIMFNLVGKTTKKFKTNNKIQKKSISIMCGAW